MRAERDRRAIILESEGKSELQFYKQKVNKSLRYYVQRVKLKLVL